MASLNKTSLLVLGGTGFIGRRVVDIAVSKKWKVSSASLSLPSPKNRNKKVKYYKIDLTNFASVKRKLNKPFNYVVNLFGYINHSNSKKDYNKIMQEHYISLKNIVKIIPKKNLKRFVQIGSSNEYGRGKAPQSEKNKLIPISTYSAAKVKSTEFLKTIYKKEKYPFSIARLFLTYGPGQKEDRFIPEIIKKCLRNEKFATPSGLQIRDFCYIDDTVSAIFLILLKKEAIGEIFNVASGKPIKIKKIIYLINKITGKGYPEFNKRKLRPGENKVLYADVKKIKKKLNWKTKTPLLNGLKKTINSYKKNAK